MSGLEGKFVFLSGPVTGLAREDACQRFLDAEMTCISLGAKYAFNPMRDVDAHLTHEEAMRVCLEELTATWLDGSTEYGLLVSLPGWEDSDGARLERAVAEAIGIPCVELGELGGERK